MNICYLMYMNNTCKLTNSYLQFHYIPRLLTCIYQPHLPQKTWSIWRMLFHRKTFVGQLVVPVWLLWSASEYFHFLRKTWSKSTWILLVIRVKSRVYGDLSRIVYYTLDLNNEFIFYIKQIISQDILVLTCHMINNLCVRFKLFIILHYKVWHRQFLNKDLELAKLTLDQNHGTLSGHTQSMYAVRTSNFSP